MNREDIIKMARESGLLVIGTADGSDAVYTWPKGITEELKRFAEFVAAAAKAEENEACAKVCEELETCSDAEFYGHEFAAVIRARGKA